MQPPAVVRIVAEAAGVKEREILDVITIEVVVLLEDRRAFQTVQIVFEIRDLDERPLMHLSRRSRKQTFQRSGVRTNLYTLSRILEGIGRGHERCFIRKLKTSGATTSISNSLFRTSDRTRLARSRSTVPTFLTSV